MRHYLTVVSVRITLMISDDQHFFMCLLTVYLFAKMSMKVLCPFIKTSQIVFLLWSGMVSICI